MALKNVTWIFPVLINLIIGMWIKSTTLNQQLLLLLSPTLPPLLPFQRFWILGKCLQSAINSLYTGVWLLVHLLTWVCIWSSRSSLRPWSSPVIRAIINSSPVLELQPSSFTMTMLGLALKWGLHHLPSSLLSILPIAISASQTSLPEFSGPILLVPSANACGNTDISFGLRPLIVRNMRRILWTTIQNHIH